MASSHGARDDRDEPRHPRRRPPWCPPGTSTAPSRSRSTHAGGRNDTASPRAAGSSTPSTNSPSQSKNPWCQAMSSVCTTTAPGVASASRPAAVDFPPALRPSTATTSAAGSGSSPRGGPAASSRSRPATSSGGLRRPRSEVRLVVRDTHTRLPPCPRGAGRAPASVCVARGQSAGRAAVSSAICARAAVTSSSLVFAWPSRPQPPGTASVSSTQVRCARPGPPPRRRRSR